MTYHDETSSILRGIQSVIIKSMHSITRQSDTSLSAVALEMFFDDLHFNYHSLAGGK